MRLNPAVAFTFILLALMVGAGIVSASWGYALGSQALTGVRQPDSRPSGATAVNSGNPTPSSGHQPVFLQEDDIIATVKARIDGNLTEAAPNQ